jgi:hypothetical protein
VRARGNNIGAGERNRGTRHPPRAPNLHGRHQRLAGQGTKGSQVVKLQMQSQHNVYR